MRRQAGRAAVLAGIIAAHVLVLRFFPAMREPPAPKDMEPPLILMLLPATPPRHAVRSGAVGAPLARQRRQIGRAGSTGSSPPTKGSAVAGESARAPIDWLGEAEAVVADRAERAAQAARRASALSQWQAHVMPGPTVPHAPEFRWDYAATHRIVRLPRGGLVININDRCAIAIIGLAILPGCRIGHIPAHGDLFEHMNDPPKLGDWMNH